MNDAEMFYALNKAGLMLASDKFMEIYMAKGRSPNKEKKKMPKKPGKPDKGC